MRYILPLLALVASALAEGVTESIAPAAHAPAGCSETSSSSFQITVVNVTSSATKRDFIKRQKAGVLTLTLNGGILKDQAGRTGYIASNYQFQFDDPPQAEAIYTAGFSLCSNSSLALGGSAVFYQCLSGSFYNLYDRHWAAQCNAIYIEAIGGSGVVSSTPSSSTPTSSGSTTPSTSTTKLTSSSDTTTHTPLTTAITVTNSSATSTGGGKSATTSPASSSAEAASTGASTSASAPSSTSPAASENSQGQSSAASGASSAASPSSSASSGAALGIVSVGQGILALAAMVVGAVAMV